MTTFNARSCNSIYVVPCLLVTDLQRMADMGYLCEDDEIRKDGHRTWYPASTVVGLIFENTVSKQIKSQTVDDWTFQLYKCDGSLEGPYNFDTLVALAKSGSITPDCELLPPACMSPIRIEKFRSVTIHTPLQRLFIKWEKDKTDGPMHAKLVEKLVKGGVIPKNCLVRGEDESEWADYSSYTFF
jgi:hypothetical protein